MRAKYIIVFNLLAILLTTYSYISTSAMTTGFDIEQIPTEQAEEFLDNINLIYESEEAHHHSIKCFDISDSGLIAVGIDEDIEKHINVYDNNGIFQYGYSFENQGTYGIEFDKDNLIIYTVRGENAYLIDNKGNCLEVCKINNSLENNSYWNHNVFAKSKKVGNSKYVLSKAIIFSPSYSKLTKISSDGTEFVIVDVSTDSVIYIIIVIIIAITVISISIPSVINYFKNN
ncbi:MAG: hypothetical protein J1E85_10200 [Ruminococcus sp.]|nr:hypothetical protein [Ruminococcus sp.]